MKRNPMQTCYKVQCCFFPHLPQRRSDRIRIIISCNRMELWTEKLVGYIHRNHTEHTQIELPILSESQIQETRNKISVLKELRFTLVANGYDTLHLSKILGKKVILGDRFNKGMAVFPLSLRYPQGRLMAFDVLKLPMGDAETHPLPYTEDFLVILKQKGYDIAGIDAGESFYEQYKEELEKLHTDLYIKDVCFGAAGENCIYKLLNDGICSYADCTDNSLSYQYIYMREGHIVPVGIRCFPRGQLVYWKIS